MKIAFVPSIAGKEIAAKLGELKGAELSIVESLDQRANRVLRFLGHRECRSVEAEAARPPW